MKPLHEDTLRALPPDKHGRHAIVGSDGCMLAETRAMDGARIARAFVAMPLLARALLGVADEQATSSVDGMPCWCINATRERLHAKFQTHHDSFCQDARDALHAANALSISTED